MHAYKNEFKQLTYKEIKYANTLIEILFNWLEISILAFTNKPNMLILAIVCGLFLFNGLLVLRSRFNKI